MADDAATIAALQQQVEALAERLAVLEGRAAVPVVAYEQPSVATAQLPPDHWAERIKLKGDVRYRHEGFNIEDRRERHRQRVRARLTAIAKVNDSVEVGFGLATGGSDPISTNQTLGSGSSSKGVVLDLAYAKWSTPIDGMHVLGGKFKNPLHRAGRNGLVWDGDLNPEGIGVTWVGERFFANGLGSWVDESGGDDDSFLLAGQFGIAQILGDGRLKAGVGYYHYLDAKGEPAFFDGDGAGNRLDANGEYVSGFELLEVFAEYRMQWNDFDLSVFADYVTNTASADDDAGFAIGSTLKLVGGSDIGWLYQELEPDAVLGTFSNSDFIGGGTDGEGHIFTVGYPLTAKIGLRGTLFLNDRNIEFGSEESYKRLMLDISFKY